MHTPSPKSNKRSFRERLFARLRETLGAPNKHHHYIVGVSGGNDSVALLHLLVCGGWKVTAVHINHNERGAAAEKDARLVEKMCRALKIPFVLKDIILKKTGKEAEGRKKRYMIFTNLIKKTGSVGVITAHHADDQAETLLLNLIRGTGLHGMRGMQKITTLKTQKGPCTIFRPLLTTSKKELRTYCAQAQIAFREDATNKNTAFTRNFVRQKILPLLATKNPQIVRALAATQEQITEGVTYIDQETEKAWQKMRKKNTIKLDDLKKLPPVLQKNMFATLIEKNVSIGKIRECHRFIKESKNGNKTIEHLILVKKGRDATLKKR